ncbi:MAG: 23S rRNA (adenine(2503)-C(2))-methyltransferase RlmN [Alphaproteobacteria bacterium]|nr:23S rRNA (adenine(2503)-C(2))-methyltransferase RlmN [Alphaproteobacteria bacterium]MBP3687532.1 23S rRNA (adenine(2503)-C(2))-methyltransferase RlmN [Alphaproteobacteria bacterium]
MTEKLELTDLTKDELTAEITKIGEKSFRAKQLWQWIYYRGETDFDKMSNLSLALRQKLSENYTITRPKIITEQVSIDKTRKWLLEFKDGERVEMVYIPEKDRGAVCISTQVGCAMGCRFCHTGSQKFTRNLTVGEIIGQFMVARDTYGEWPSPTDETRYLSNIVVMGMGEPLNNLDNVVKALNIITDNEGISISRRRVTMSTSGIAPRIVEALQKTGVRLAVSLHAPNNTIRSQIMPINDKFKIEEVMKACAEYQKGDHSRYITFEYLLLKGINDSEENAKELVSLLKKNKLRALFNLIPFNPWPGCSFAPSDRKTVEAFSEILEKAGFAAPIRVARGQDILAACGQLKSKHPKA